MMKTASKTEVAELARQMIGPELDSAKSGIVSDVVNLSEPRIAALAARLAKLEERIDGVAKDVRIGRAAQLTEIHSRATRKELEDYSSGVYERFKVLEQRIAAMKAIEPVLGAVGDKIAAIEERLGVLEDNFSKLRDFALNEILSEIREQAVQRDKELYRRVEDLGARTKAEITAEKAKLTQQFKESARIIEERRESVSELQEDVAKALNKYGNAYTALLREFEALKAGIRIGKGE